MPISRPSPEIQTPYQFSLETHEAKRFVVQGITCSACVLEIEQLLLATPGVLKARVDGVTESAQLKWDRARVTETQLVARVAQAGYQLIRSADPALQEIEQIAVRRMLLRLAIALLCMMQVMMYVTPIYISAPGEIDPSLEGLLRWAAWVLTIPVVRFSSGPFLQGALQSLKRRKITMDVSIALGIVMAFIAGTIATFDPTSVLRQEIYLDSLVMFVSFILVGRYLERVLRRKALARVDALLAQGPNLVTRELTNSTMTSTRVEIVDAVLLKIGDFIRLKPGNVVPVDAKVCDYAIELQESLLTGESKPVTRQPGELALAGTINLQKIARLQVTSIGTNTQFAKLRQLIDTACETRPDQPLQIDRIAPIFFFLVLGFALLAGVLWWPIDPAKAVQVSIAVLIVSCPCALALASPLALLRSAGVLAARGILVQRLAAIEQLASVTSVVFDKTGTLTHDVLEVSAMQRKDSVFDSQLLRAVAALSQPSTHPVSRALFEYAKSRGVEAAQIDEKTWTEVAGAGVQARIRSGPFSGQLLQLGSATFTGQPVNASVSFAVHLIALSEAQKRTWLASFSIAEKLRPDAVGTITALKGQGLAVNLLSGDKPDATERVAQLVGLKNLGRDSYSPEGKLQFITELQAQDQQILMVGDGINDAASLARANVSVVLNSASAIAQAKADFIIQSERLNDLLVLRRLSRKTKQVIRSNMAWAIGYNLGMIPLTIAGLLPAWAAGLGMAASSALVVANTLRIRLSA
jgi:P-type Cu2+ transporter